MEKLFYLILTVISLCFYFAFFLLLSNIIVFKGTAQSYEISKRLISFTHGIFFLCYSILSIGDFFSFNSYNTIPIETYLCMSLGYFIFDTIACISFKINVKRAVIHHSIVILMIISGLVSKIGLNEAVYIYFITEFSNSCLHVKESLLVLGHKQSKSYILTEIVFIFSFIFSRFIVGSLVTFKIVTNPSILMGQKALFISLQCLFASWLPSMFQALNKRLDEYKKHFKALPWLCEDKKN